MHKSSLNNNTVFSPPPIVAGIVPIVVGTVIGGILMACVIVKNFKRKYSSVHTIIMSCTHTKVVQFSSIIQVCTQLETCSEIHGPRLHVIMTPPQDIHSSASNQLWPISIPHLEVIIQNCFIATIIVHSDFMLYIINIQRFGKFKWHVYYSRLCLPFCF